MIMMTPSSIEDIYSYQKQALDLIPLDHPHYDEIRDLLTSQIKDEINAYANSKPNRGTG